MANADPRSGGRGASSRPRGGLSSSHNVAWTTKCDTESGSEQMRVLVWLPVNLPTFFFLA